MFKLLTTTVILFSASVISLSAYANPSATASSVTSASYNTVQTKRPSKRVARQKIEPKIVQKVSTKSERAVFFNYSSDAKTKVVTHDRTVTLSTPNHFSK